MKLIQIRKNLLQGNIAVISAEKKGAFTEEWENKYMVLLNKVLFVQHVERN
jgi:hypothetical protein